MGGTCTKDIVGSRVDAQYIYFNFSMHDKTNVIKLCYLIVHLCPLLYFRCVWNRNHVIVIYSELKGSAGPFVHIIESISTTNSSENTNATPYLVQFKDQRKDNYR